MERLVTTSEAAQLLGLSLQGVHYRIKNGQLKSLKQGGKTFVYVTEFFQQELKAENNAQPNPTLKETIEIIVESKNEQISLLKQSIGFIKEQYNNEIRRVEKNQKRIIKVFNSEIQLLQSAFNEMRSIYKPQIQSTQESPMQSVQNFMPMTDFFIFLKQHNKTDKQIKNILLNAVQRKDSRFVYNKETKKVFITNSDYSDLV